MLNRCRNLVLAGVQGVSEVLPDPASFLAKTTRKLRREARAGSVWTSVGFAAFSF